jgi:hypothetical protein
MDAFSKQNPNQGARLLGRVSLQALSALKRVIFGELVMDRKLIYRMIVGYQVAGI